VSLVIVTIFTTTNSLFAASGKKKGPEPVVISANSASYKGECIPVIQSIAEDGTSTPFILPEGYRLVVTDFQATLNGTAIDGTTRGSIRIDGSSGTPINFGINFAQQGMDRFICREV